MFCFHRVSQYPDNESYPTETFDAQKKTERDVAKKANDWATRVVNAKVQCAEDLYCKKRDEKRKAQQQQQQEQGRNNQVGDDDEEDLSLHPNFGSVYLPTDVASGEYKKDQHLYPTVDLEPKRTDIVLNRVKMIKNVSEVFNKLPGFASYRSIHCWPIFWCIHALDLLDYTPIPMFDVTTGTTIVPPPNNAQKVIAEQTAKFWTPEFALRFLSFMSQFQAPDGGFTGTFGFRGHVLITYAAVHAMVTVAARAGVIDQIFNYIDLQNLRRFFLSVKITDPNNEDFGSFMLSTDGEVDTRGVYCLLSTCDLLGLLPDVEITDNVIQWLQRCQAHDGGFAAQPGWGESHGGYTAIALASFIILEASHFIPNIDLLEKWAVSRQFELEGGFSGRTTKLVDSCYSYWSGAVLPLIQLARQDIALYQSVYPEYVVSTQQIKKITRSASSSQIKTQQEYNELKHNTMKLLSQNTLQLNIMNLLNGIEFAKQQQQQQQEKDMQDENNNDEKQSSSTTTNTPQSLLHTTCCSTPPKELGWVFDQAALQEYILIACQDESLLADKPGVPSDYYHTCYGLSGLAIAQYSTTFGKLSYSSYLKNSKQKQKQQDKNNGEEKEKQNNNNNIYNQNIINCIQQMTPITRANTSICTVGPRAGPGVNLLQANNVIYNISQGVYRSMHDFLRYYKSNQKQ